LSGCGAISDTTTAALAPSFGNLKTWSFWDCKQLSGRAIEALAASCAKLERVQLSHRGVEGLKTTTSCSGATLVCLSLVRVAFADDSELLAAAENCHRLRELELSSCTGIRTECLVQLTSAVPFLEDLLLANLNCMTDNVLIAISTHLPQLLTLNLYKSPGYTENAAQTLIQSLTRLRRFAIDPKHAVFTSLVLCLWKDRLLGLEINVMNCRRLGAKSCTLGSPLVQP
jgi:hypothetical protein